MGIDYHHVLRSDENRRIAVQHRLRTRLSEVNTVSDLLYLKQAGVRAGSSCTSPRSTMVGKFQNRRPSQGAPHHDPKEVAARGVTMTGVVVRMCMGMGVRVILPRVAVMVCVLVHLDLLCYPS
jgi:hypothetical protein